MTLDRIHNFIGGRESRPRGSAVHRCINPSDLDDVIGEYPLSCTGDVDAAVAAAEAARRDWARTSAARRGALLTEAARHLLSDLDAIAAVTAREIGKPVVEARGEALVAARILEFYGAEGLRFGGETLPSTRERVHMYTERRPLGIVGLITPWNYPLSIPAWKIGPALLAGNTAVWKPSLQHPQSSHIVLSALRAAGVPDGVINLVHGDGPDIGDTLVRHPGVAGLSFTGSRPVGEAIYRAGSQRLARVSCEMGGKNPLLVLADADLDVAVDLAVEGAFRYAGQKCTGTGRVIVDARRMAEFRARLAARCETLPMGDARREDVFLGPVVDAQQFARVSGFIRDAIATGARLVHGRERTVAEGGYYIAPTVLDGIGPDARIVREEVFGPVLVLQEAADFDAAIELANRTEYGLSASVCTRSLALAHEAIERLETGIVYVNLATAGAEYHAPFGGIKGSGLGPTEQGLKVLEFYSHWRAVSVRAPDVMH